MERHLRLEPKPFRAAHADGVPEVPAGGRADQQEGHPEGVRDEHAIRRHEGERAEDRAEQGEGDRGAHDARGRLLPKVLGVALDDAVIKVFAHGRLSLIGAKRGRLEGYRREA
jgi:hypothetical protein